MRTTTVLTVASSLVLSLPACVGQLEQSSSSSNDDGEQADVSTTSVIDLARANIGGRACGDNSLGEHAFDNSCTGNGGEPEYWCADFVKWVWQNKGVDVSELSAAAGSFYVYGQNHGTLSDTPAVGDAVVFNYEGDGYADHVAIVDHVFSNGTIETISGDWGGENGTEAHFSSTSSVVFNSPAYSHTVGTTPDIMGMRISGYISPKGVSSAPPPPPPPAASACAGLDNGFYCGGDGIVGNRNTLYQCSGGEVAETTACAHSCQYNPPGVPDMCGCEGLNDGDYCGQDSSVGGSTNTLYACENGTLEVKEVCAQGCIDEPGDLNDTCR